MKKSIEKSSDPLQSKNSKKTPKEMMSNYERDLSKITVDELLVSLEEEFHRDFVPKDVIMKVLQLTCEYYGGDWCGALDVQSSIDLWTPRWWFNRRFNGMEPASIQHYENVSDYPEWIKALNSEEIVCIKNLHKFERTDPERVDRYRKLGAKSVIAAPYYKGVTGFLIVRNPTKFIDNTNLIKLMSYIVSSEMNEYRMIEGTKHQLIAENIKDENDVLINLFGRFEIITAKGIAKPEAIQGTQIAQIICYLCINQKHAKSPRSIAESLIDDPDDAEAFANNMKYYIYRFRQNYSDLFADEELICTTKYGYQLNKKLHIITDLDQFDQLYETAEKISDPEEKINILEKLMTLYKGDIFPPCSLEQWLMPVTMKYSAHYLQSAERLFKLLDQRQDYSELHEYAVSGLCHETNNEKMYYWLIVSMVQKNEYDMAMKEYKTSESKLDSLSYQSLTQHLHTRYGSYGKLFDK